MSTPEDKLADIEHFETNEGFFCEINRTEIGQGLVVGYVAGMPITFMIDSGADVNTIDQDSFDCLSGRDPGNTQIFSLKPGTDLSFESIWDERGNSGGGIFRSRAIYFHGPASNNGKILRYSKSKSIAKQKHCIKIQRVATRHGSTS